MATVEIPLRPGDRPETTDTNPHSQISQPIPRDVHDKLAEQAFSLPYVSERPSRVSVPGTRSLVLSQEAAGGPPEAFLSETEFCHLHSPEDGSLHMALPPAIVEEAKEQGWAETHPVAEMGLIPKTVVLVYGPRDEDELATVLKFVGESYTFARGVDDIEFPWEG